MLFRKDFWVLIILTALTIFINLGGLPLLDPDEPVYAETPKEMIQYNDYISPRIYGQFWYDKPPMYYWLVAGAFRLIGVGEYAARFPSAVLGILCVVLVYGLTSKILNKRAGLVSGMVLATSLEYFYLCKAAVTDITLTFCLTAALLFFLRRQYYLLYFFSALATLTKGPIGFLFPGAIILVWMALTRNFAELKRMKIPVGAILFLVVAAPWYWVMYKIHGGAFMEGFIGVNNITRFTTAEHAKTSAWYFFIPVLIAGFFPWISLLPQTVRCLFRDKDKDHYPALLFLLIWAAFIFVFFSISSTKLITYILPVFPPLAILVGWYIDRKWEMYRLAGWGVIWPVTLTVLSLVLIGGALFGIKTFPEVKSGAVILAIVLLAMLCLVWYYLGRKEVAKAFWVQSVGMVIISVTIVTLLFPPIADTLSSRVIATKFMAEYDNRSPVYVIKFLHPGFTFYSGVYGTELKSTEDLRKVVHQDKEAYLVVQQSDYQGLNDMERKSLILLNKTGKMLLLRYNPISP